MTNQIDMENIVEHGAYLNKQVFGLQLERFKADSEKQAVNNFLRTSADISSFLMEHKQDQVALANLETDLLRPLAVELRQYNFRQNLTCCTPFWSEKSTTQPNDFVVFGCDEFKKEVATLAKSLDLTVVNECTGGTPDQIRWDAICRSNFGLFDFRQNSRNEKHLASTSHALGLALSVGTLPVILTDVETHLPFDVYIDPLNVPQSSEASKILSDAMTTAAVAQYQIRQLGNSNSILQTIDYVLEQVGSDSIGAQYMRPYIETLRNAEPPDPISIRLYLQSLLDQSGGGEYALLTPMWPVSYPDQNAPRCFHILPFILPDSVSRAVESGCQSLLDYQRGDTTGEIDIIKGIWNGIGQATHVVVDLTPADTDGTTIDGYLNPNVCLELAMAQVLGRKLLLVRNMCAKDSSVFPEIAKLQIIPYESTSTLTKYVEQFVSDKTILI